MWQNPVQAVGWRGTRRRYSMLTPPFPDPSTGDRFVLLLSIRRTVGA
jgi:hypothetical protein